jgi:hypothetical protein
VFGSNLAQARDAIFVLACLSATRPVPGRPFQVIHYNQIVRYRARFVRGLFDMEAKHGYRNSKIF